jgi:hypothetical protein
MVTFDLKTGRFFYMENHIQIEKCSTNCFFKTNVDFDIRPKGENSNPVFHRKHDLIFFSPGSMVFQVMCYLLTHILKKNDICSTNLVYTSTLSTIIL